MKKICIPRWLTSLLKFAALILSSLPSVYIFAEILRNKSNLSALGYAFMLLPALYFFGITFACLYSGNMAFGIIDFLLYPRRFAKTPPIITARQKGLIAAKKYQLARTELLNMRAKAPASPDVTWLLVELNSTIFNHCQQASMDILFYCKHRSLRYHRFNLRMALRYADFQQQLNQLPEAVRFLRQEASNCFCYTARERKLLLQRAEAIEDSLNR